MVSVVLCTSRGVVSTLIRWVTKSTVSHAALVTMFHHVPIVIHAAFGGVRVDRMEHFLKQHHVVVGFEPNFDMGPSLASAVRSIDEDYDYVGMIGFLVVMIARRMGMAIRNPLASPRAVVCSEFVARTLRLEVEPETTTPQDLLVLMRGSPQFRQIIK